MCNQKTNIWHASGVAVAETAATKIALKRSLPISSVAVESDFKKSYSPAKRIWLSTRTACIYMAVLLLYTYYLIIKIKSNGKQESV